MGSVETVEEVEKIRDDPGGFSFEAIVNLLNKGGISWKYYLETMPPVADEKMPPDILWYLLHPDPKQFCIVESASRIQIGSGESSQLSKSSGTGSVLPRSRKRNDFPGVLDYPRV